MAGGAGPGPGSGADGLRGDADRRALHRLGEAERLDRLAEGRRVPAAAAAVLAVGWRARGRRRHLLGRALVVVLGFETWRSLTGEGAVTRAEAVELAVGLVEAARSPRGGPGLG